MSNYIAWLDSSDGVSPARVGGKAASLARLGAAGFPVPPGFAVTVDGYRAFHEAYVARKDGSITRKDVMDKHIRVVPSDGGTAQEPTPPDHAAAPALSDEEISVVARSAAAVEEHYGVPVDIESAFDSAGRFHILQGRPITTHCGPLLLS